MRISSMIHFKPKLEYFDQRLKALKDALKGHEHYILTRDREVFQDWVSYGIADLADFQYAGLSFFDECRHILEEYEGGSLSMPINAFIEQQPASGGLESF